MVNTNLEQMASKQHIIPDTDNQVNKWVKMNDALHKSLFLYLPLTGLGIIGTDLGTDVLTNVLHNSYLYNLTMSKPLDACLSAALTLLSAPIAVYCGLNVAKEFKKAIRYHNEYNKLKEAE